MEKEELALRIGFRIDNSGNLYNPRGKLLKGCTRKGYKCFKFRVDYETYYISVHRFQAYVKFGERLFEPNIMVRHLDGNPLNNSFSNIEIGTGSQNQFDIPRKERLKRSSVHIRYSPEVVKEIREKRKQGYKYSDLMKEYNIPTKSTIHNILNVREI